MLLVGSWTIAQLRQGPAYDPAKQTLSVLASYGAGSYWLMTGMLLVLGTCYVVTAHALREAAFAGRVALAGGGLCALALTLVPAPSSGGALEHGAVATAGLVLLAVWPPLAAVSGKGPVPWGLRPDVSLAASALMGATAFWFLAELQSVGAPGVAERVVTFLQALWPFLVVVSCRRSVR
ncbi:integral membrane protein [Streptomyces sp. CBMAI 2042]|nr:integral membrane protein [Streptomyces sp. CBMAI 2042]